MGRSATAVWRGTGKEGKGNLTTSSGVLDDTPYSFRTRFEDEKGTNPEELIAAAHAGCFNMKLSFNLSEAGFPPEKLDTKCLIKMDAGKIVQSKLTLKAQVPGISAEEFDKQAKDAEDNCPISQLLDTEIILEYDLEN